MTGPASLADWAATRYIARSGNNLPLQPLQLIPGVSFARHHPSRRLAHLAAADRFHRRHCPDY
jgi:hypothetical protein